MLPAAKEEMLSPLAPSMWSEEEIFSFAAGVALAALGTHQGARPAQDKKPHQGFFSENPALRIGEIRAKWSGTHQDSETWGRKTSSGSALDANGNTLTDAQGRSFTWDFENRLMQVIVPGQNGGTTTFKYDPFGRRIQESGPLGTTNYLYDGPSLVEEVDGTGNVLARYANQMRVDEPLSELRSGTTSFYLQDGLGSVTSISSGSGALSNTYTFDSYGKQIASTGTVTNPFQYTGRESDQETGLYYYRARYYDASTGRFISEDPIGFRGGPNFYDYVGNDPVDFNDPRGLLKPNPLSRWRYCTANEVSECTKTCNSQGKEYESCRVSQTYRIIRLVNGPQWVDGPLSCSCKEPNNECPQPHRITLPDPKPIAEIGIIGAIGITIIRALEFAF